MRRYNSIDYRAAVIDLYVNSTSLAHHMVTSFFKYHWVHISLHLTSCMLSRNHGTLLQLLWYTNIPIARYSCKGGSCILSRDTGVVMGCTDGEDFLYRQLQHITEKTTASDL